LNKVLVPALLGIVVLIAGIFAFVPIEKSATVHGLLATVTTNTNNDALIATEADGQDRYAFWQINTTASGFHILIPADSGTITGYAVLTAEPNNHSFNSRELIYQCGLSTTNDEQLGINATQGNTTALALSTVLDGTDGIILESVTSTNEIEGVCSVTLIIDSGTG